MQTEILPHVQEAACYICGSKEIVKVCHHCGRAMCAEHEPFTIPQSRFFERIRNDEWNGIDLPETDDAETAVHCGFCLHYTKTYDPLLFIPVIIGLAFFMAATVMIALFQISIWHAVQLVLLGIAYFVVSTWGFIISEDYHFLMMRKDRTPIPFWGKFPPARVRIVESAHGKITLDSDGMYNLQVKNTSGVLHFLLQLTESDDDRLYQYRQKYGLRDFEEELFLTGFAVLHGTERLRSKSGIRAPKELNFIQLKDSTDTLPHLNRSAYHRQWQYDQKYAFTFENQHSSGFPVHIVPSLISEGDEWGLELYVQVNPDIDASLLSKPKVQILELETRDFSGEVETFVPAAKKTSNTSRNQHKIIWQNLMLKTNEPVMNKSFYVRFANSRNIKPDFIIEGTLTLKFEGAISGLQSVDLFSPLGQKTGTVGIRSAKSSEVIIDFEFDLAALCLRQFRSATHSIELSDVVPGNEMITRLVNALSANDIYVQRVVENPQQMNWANAHIMDRHWVITGRHYLEATPVDFRVVAVGQEQYEHSSDTPHDGKTKFEIIAQGMITREDMQANIEYLRDNILEVLPHTPELKIHPIESKLYMNEWCCLKGTIKNIGKESVEKIAIFATGIKDSKIECFNELVPDNSMQFNLSIYVEKKGSVPIAIVATCEDKFGKLPAYKKQLQIQVQEKEQTKVSSIITHFNQPVTGNILSGTGDINIDNRDNHE